VYYAARYRFPSALPSDLKIHAQKSANVSAPAQKIRESRSNAQNSIPDVRMNNLPSTPFYAPCAVRPPFASPFFLRSFSRYAYFDSGCSRRGKIVYIRERRQVSLVKYCAQWRDIVPYRTANININIVREAVYVVEQINILLPIIYPRYSRANYRNS